MVDREVVAFFIGALIGFCAGFMIGYIVCNEDWQADMIKRDHAEYNSKNGNWQWKEPRASPAVAPERELDLPLSPRP